MFYIKACKIVKNYPNCTAGRATMSPASIATLIEAPLGVQCYGRWAVLVDFATIPVWMGVYDVGMVGGFKGGCPGSTYKVVHPI